VAYLKYRAMILMGGSVNKNKNPKSVTTEEYNNKNYVKQSSP